MSGPRPYVYKIDSDWVFECVVHDEEVVCYSWQNAYETALGHVAMHHPRFEFRLYRDPSPRVQAHLLGGDL